MTGMLGSADRFQTDHACARRYVQRQKRVWTRDVGGKPAGGS